MGFTELNQVEQYYVERIIEIVARKGSYYIIWEDPINKGVKVRYRGDIFNYKIIRFWYPFSESGHLS